MFKGHQIDLSVRKVNMKQEILYLVIGGKENCCTKLVKYYCSFIPEDLVSPWEFIFLFFLIMVFKCYS